MSFITTTPLIGKRLKATDYRQYAAEIFLLLFLGAAYMGFADLAGLRGGAPVTTVSRNAFALMGALGLYGMRLSSFIAMARHYRMPQVAEWSVFLLTFAVMVILFILSGTFVKSYAAAMEILRRYVLTSRRTGGGQTAVAILRAVVWAMVVGAVPLVVFVAAGVATSCYGQECDDLSRIFLIIVLVWTVLAALMVIFGYLLLKQASWLQPRD